MYGRNSAPSASLNIESAAAVVHLQLGEHKVMRQWRYHVPCFPAQGNNLLCTVDALAPAG
jgi:hypothetical protein